MTTVREYIGQYEAMKFQIPDFEGEDVSFLDLFDFLHNDEKYHPKTLLSPLWIRGRLFDVCKYAKHTKYYGRTVGIWQIGSSIVTLQNNKI